MNFNFLKMGVAIMGVLFSSKSWDNTLLVDTARLVEVSQIAHMTTLSIARLYFPHTDRNDETYVKFYKCLSTTNTDVFKKIYTEVLAKHMSPTEVHDAIYFYESPVGKKFLHRSLTQVYQMLDFPTGEKLDDISKEENEELKRFSKTAAGEKLVLKNILHLPSVGEQVMDKQQEIAKQCINNAY